MPPSDTMFLLLVVAGNETTRQAIAHGMPALVEHPDQWARRRDDRRLAWETGADEILRSPRVADVELAGAVERVSTNFTNAIKRMPVRIAPRTGVG